MQSLRTCRNYNRPKRTNNMFLSYFNRWILTCISYQIKLNQLINQYDFGSTETIFQTAFEKIMKNRTNKNYNWF